MQNTNHSKRGALHRFSFDMQPKWVHRMFRAVVVVLVMIYSSRSEAQTTTYPSISPSSCTSKDLELVSATLAGIEGCNVDTGNKQLILKINNKTGSSRTSFAFWGKLYINGVFDREIYACASNVPGDAISTIPSTAFINYQNGNSYVIKDLFLAWTTANKKETCDILAATPNAIAPKCGILDSIEIPSGVYGNPVATKAACASGKGNIAVSPGGGKGPYQVSVYKSGNYVDSASVDAGSTKNFSLDPGTYDIYVYDSRPCKVSYTKTVDDPDPLTAPTRTVYQAGCIIRTGSVKITNYNSNYTYYLTKSAGDTSFFSSDSIGDLNPGTYTFAVTLGICTTSGTSVVLDPAPPIPSAPTGCITQPTLCGLTKAAVSIQSPTSGDGSPFEYSIDSSTWKSSNQFADLSAGSSPRFWVKNSYGCISNGASACGFTSGCTTVAEDNVASEIKSEEVVNTKRPAPTTNILGSGTLESGVTIKAVPNPFGNKVRFMITTEEAGNGVLEIYNIQGQKLKTVFQGYVPAGINFYDLTVPAQRRAELIYVFRKGTEQFSGKLLQLDKE